MNIDKFTYILYMASGIILGGTAILMFIKKDFGLGSVSIILGLYAFIKGYSNYKKEKAKEI